MSREIKFRAWNNANNEWLDKEDAECLTMHLDGRYEIDMGWVKVFPDLIIEQYTGLKDKNGKEIYEGDIVKIPDWQVKPKYEKVRFAKLSCGFEPFVCGCFECIAPDGEEVEVIGNIHENPELLEDK